MSRTIASPTPTSAAATAITKSANTWPATSPWNAPNATRFRFTAVRMSSIDIRTSTPFLRASTPYTPVLKRNADSRRNWLRCTSVPPRHDDRPDEGGEQQDRDDLEGHDVALEDG